MSISWIDLGIIGAYLLAMLSIGYYVFRRAPSFEEYLIAGRSMTTPVLVCTLASTYYCLDVLFGTSEVAFNDGVVAYFGYAVLYLGLYAIAAFVLSKRLRTANFTSLPEILERHYGTGAAIFGALASIFYSIPALSLFALGRISEVIFGVDAMVGAAVIGAIALLYTVWGGLWAVAITDTIQFVLMCVTLAIGVPMLMGKVGGFDVVAQFVPGEHFNLLGGLPIWLLISYVATGLSVFVEPGFYQRIFAAQSYRQARNAILIAVLIWGTYDWLVVAGGMLARSAVGAGILPADIHPNDALLMAVIHALPVGLVGIFLAGVLSTAMSTVDSYTLVAGSNMAYDIYRPLRRREVSDQELVRLTKRGVVASWVLGYALAFMFDRLMALWVFTATILTSTVFVPIFIGLYRKGRKTSLAGTLSCAMGLVSVIVYYITIFNLGEQNTTYGTYIWSFDLGGVSISLWQEYGLFFSLPMSVVGFLIGNRMGRSVASGDRTLDG
jgi:SSS family solute:Na+ symporter